MESHFCLTYSGYGKYSDPLKFFTLCFIAANLLKSKKLFYFSLMYTQQPILTEKNRNVEIFANLLKRKSETSNGHKYPDPFAQY